MHLPIDRFEPDKRYRVTNVKSGTTTDVILCSTDSLLNLTLLSVSSISFLGAQFTLSSTSLLQNSTDQSQSEETAFTFLVILLHSIDLPMAGISADLAF